MQLRVVGGAALVAAIGACTLEAEPLGPLADAGDDGGGVLPGTDAAVPVVRCKDFSESRKVFFGDLHVHTALSLEAHALGTRLRPDLAYAFARGQEVGLPPFTEAGAAARTLKLTRPLDFAAVTDQAEYLGLVAACQTAGLPGYMSAQCVAYRAQPASTFTMQFLPPLLAAQGMATLPEPCGASTMGCGVAAAAAWSELRQAASKAQDNAESCAFSAFLGYEWTASPAARSLRRSVVFASEQVPARPFGYFDGNRVEDLWTALDRECLQTNGCEALTIPTNANLSSGGMFAPVDMNGAPIDRANALRRASYEPLMEIFQIEGSSECAQEDDALCGFEQLPYQTFARELTSAQPLPSAFARGALAEGMRQLKDMGLNPFPLGFVAGTGSYYGVPGAVEEPTFPGSGGSSGGTSLASGIGGIGGAILDKLTQSLVAPTSLNPGGLTAIWAEQNTRASLFAALKRREVYATSGPRIALRVFGGASVPDDLCSASDFAARGYATGVPMGGTVKGGAALRIAVRAERDPGTSDAPGGKLQRVQVVKGVAKGKEGTWTIFDVAGGPNDASVDAATCTPQGAGTESLCGVWTDPDFDPKEPAAYYVRVLENPSCRWVARACLAAKVDCGSILRPAGLSACCDATVPKLQQERAWSSPIFYQP